MLLFFEINHDLFKYPSLSKIRHIKAPVLFLSGGQDELVPAQMMEKLHEVRGLPSFSEQ